MQSLRDRNLVVLYPCIAAALIIHGCDSSTTTSSQPQICAETCEFAGDGECDDGGPGSITSGCELGTDCADCGSRIDADQIGVDLAAEVIDQMPSSGAKVIGVLGAADGPEGSLFGFALDEGSVVHVLGELSDTIFQLNGVVVSNDQGELLYQQNLTHDGMELVLPSGDAVEFVDNETTSRLIFTLNATQPASRVVLDIDADGNTVVNDAESVWESVPNPDYDDGAVRSTISNETGKRQPSERHGFPPPTLLSCDEKLDLIISMAELACDAKSIATNKLPKFVIETGCVALSRALEAVRGDVEDSSRFRVVTGFKIGFAGTCELLKVGVTLGDTATKMNPIGIACTALELADDSISAGSGKSVGQLVCDALNGEDPSVEDSSTTPDTDTDGESGGSFDSCTAATGSYTVLSYINADKSTGSDAFSAQIKITGVSNGNPTYCFSSLTTATDLVVQDATAGTPFYGISALDLTVEGGGDRVIASPVTHGDTTLSGISISPFANPPSSLSADGTSYVIWIILREDADGDGFQDSAWLTFQLAP